MATNRKQKHVSACWNLEGPQPRSQRNLCPATRAAIILTLSLMFVSNSHVDVRIRIVDICRKSNKTPARNYTVTRLQCCPSRGISIPSRSLGCAAAADDGDEACCCVGLPQVHTGRACFACPDDSQQTPSPCLRLPISTSLSCLASLLLLLLLPFPSIDHPTRAFGCGCVCPRKYSFPAIFLSSPLLALEPPYLPLLQREKALRSHP
jgi:hypothetical protein